MVRTPYGKGVLLPGQSITHTVSVETGEALFVTQRTTNTLSTKLIDPNGQIIDPTLASGNPDIVSYEQDGNTEIYQFPQIVSGEWQIVVSASTNTPSEGASFKTFVIYESDLALTAAADQFWYRPGATAAITATLSEELVSSAIVTATFLYTDGATDSLQLPATTPGNYQASHLVPASPGYTELRVTAQGTKTDGQPFEIQTSSALQVSSGNISLTDQYNDIPGPLTTPYYETLTVTIGVNVTISGTYGASADLVDENGDYVAHANTIQSLDVGNNNLILRFDGNEIFNSRLNGPYTVTNLLLTNDNEAALVEEMDDTVYETSSYNYSDFGEFVVLLPMVIKE